MATLEEFKTECRSELQALRDGDGIYKQVNNERLPISDDDFEQMVVDCANSKFDQQENGYKTARQEAYDSTGNQLDQLFWDIHNNKLDKTGEWYKAIKAVKDANPKP